MDRARGRPAQHATERVDRDTRRRGSAPESWATAGSPVRTSDDVPPV